MARRVFVTSSAFFEPSHSLQLATLPSWEIVSELPTDPDDRTITLIVAPLRMLMPLLRDRPRGPALLPYGPPDHTAQAFLLGAQDYVCTPVAPQELLARADRLDHHVSRDPFVLGAVFTIAGGSLVLTGVQREILALLTRHAGGVVDREAIQAVCGRASVTACGSRSVDMAMCRLRRALQDYPVHIETVRGRGYRLVIR